MSLTSEVQDQWVRLYVGPGEGAPEIVHARYVTHSFARHAHDEYVIGLVESGVQAFRCRGTRQVTPSRHVFLIDAGEAHTGEAASPAGYVYRTLYPSISLLSGLAREIARATLPGPVAFREAVVRDERLTAKLSKFHLATTRHRPALEREALLIEGLVHLLSRYADLSGGPRKLTREDRAVRRAREYLEAHFEENVSLSELAAITGLSAFHLARTFAAQVGLPPHTYQECLRITRARKLVAAGIDLAQVAAAVGYSDQSHLTRRFQRFVGLTPGRYRHDRKIVQDDCLGRA